jgi:hypothetical protein
VDITGKSGIDGEVALSSFLDELEGDSEIARGAPRAPALYRYLLEGEAGPDREAFTAFIETLVRRLGIWWSPQTYSRMPVLTPWCVRDRSCRYDQGPESWGAPLPSGYLRDDNSIIKKLPLPLLIDAPSDHPYAARKAWRGFTACHVWRDLSSGVVAGEDAWLYSFVPNLVWLPRWMAPLSDRQGSQTQALLKRISLSLFRKVPTAPGVREFAERSWDRLGVGPQAAGAEEVAELAKFTPNEAFFRRRLASIDMFVDGCASVLAGRPLERKIVCSRYTNGLPGLDHTLIAEFSEALYEYAQGVRLAQNA